MMAATVKTPTPLPRKAAGRDRTARMNAEVPELMGLTEVARELGVKTSNVDKVVGLPAEVQKLERGRVWRADLVREFAALRRKR